jgi:hypothetical protein
MRYQALLIALLTLTSTAVAFDLGSQQPAKPLDGAVYQPPAEPPRQGGDTIEEAIPITIPGTFTGTTVGYTNNYDEVCPYPDSTAPDVVYSVTPAMNAVVDIDLCYSSFDTKLYVYDANLNLVACNDDAHFGPPCFTYSSRLEDVPLQADVTYYIVIDGYGSSAGEYQLDIAETEPCVITVPPPGPGIQHENEPPLVDGYQDAHNGGCNSPEFGHPFQTISNDLFCGVSGWYTDAGGEPRRDTDWFLVPVNVNGRLDITGDAEHATYVFELYPQDCGSVLVQQNLIIGPCNEHGETMTIEGEPGALVWLWVGPTTFDGPVNEYNYVLELNINVPVATESRSWTGVRSLFR